MSGTLSGCAEVWLHTPKWLCSHSITGFGRYEAARREKLALSHYWTADLSWAIINRQINGVYTLSFAVKRGARSLMSPAFALEITFPDVWYKQDGDYWGPSVTTLIFTLHPALERFLAYGWNNNDTNNGHWRGRQRVLGKMVLSDLADRPDQTWVGYRRGNKSVQP